MSRLIALLRLAVSLRRIERHLRRLADTGEALLAIERERRAEERLRTRPRRASRMVEFGTLSVRAAEDRWREEHPDAG